MADLPDLSQPFDPADVPDGGMLHGTVGDDEVVVVRVDGELRAIGASCSHYGGPLAEGVFDGRCVRCPWHHAAFDAATGRAERGPAITAVDAYDVTVRDGRATLAPAGDRPTPAPPLDPGRVVVVGGGPAAHAFTHRLVERGHTGPITVITSEPGRPIDRPNVSKDYLAGEAPADWMPLPGGDVYDRDHVDLRVGRSVTAIDLPRREVTTDDDERTPFDVLVVATGAQPRRLPGDDGSIRYLRSQQDADAIAAALGEGGRAVVIGASFIGLEAASALIARGASVDLVAPEDAPLAGIVGEDVSARIQQAQLGGGVVLHLGRQVQSVEGGRVLLDDGTLLEADVVVAGIGVEPRTALLDPTAAEVDDGVAVDAAFHALDADGQPLDHLLVLGDIARAPVGGGRARIEHVSVAISHGMAAADALLGVEGAMPGAPFFWTAQHDFSLRYVGHATDPDRFEVDGDAAADDCTVKVWQDDRIAAVITVGRDDVALRAELALERGDQAALAAL